MRGLWFHPGVRPRFTCRAKAGERTGFVDLRHEDPLRSSLIDKLEQFGVRARRDGD